ncbi:MAG: ABC transporter ATP-binding protein [Proteobacteria bacterium]|nr:ABC transporter ATP-binding protein [Pseudomonadota bacterium]
MAGPILTVADLAVAIAGRRVVDGISFAVKTGETLAIVGESGCGKSMTAFAIMRLLPQAARISGGAVLFEGRDLARIAESEMKALRGNRISLIFQEPASSLDPLMTVADQLIEAINAHKPASHSEAAAHALAMLRAVGIADPARRMRQYPFELSGGMCQRVMIAIALACRPSVLLADEPTTALDVTIQAQILELMKRLRSETGTSIVLITHDMGVVADMADRVLVMYAGRIVEEAAVDDLFQAQHHPYTMLLMRSVPRLDAPPKRALPVIEGTVPSYAALGTGCRFASRCPFVSEHCRAEEPPLRQIAPGRATACWHHERVAAAGMVPA